MNGQTLLIILAFLVSLTSISLSLRTARLKDKMKHQLNSLKAEVNTQRGEIDNQKERIRELNRELKLRQAIDCEKLIYQEIVNRYSSLESGQRQNLIGEMKKIEREISLRLDKLQLIAAAGEGETANQLKGEIAALKTQKALVEESFKSLSEYAKQTKAQQVAASFLFQELEQESK